MEENGTLDLTKLTSEKEPGVYDVENDYVFGFRSATQMLNDLAEKLELLEKRYESNRHPHDLEVESQEIMKSTMEDELYCNCNNYAPKRHARGCPMRKLEGVLPVE